MSQQFVVVAKTTDIPTGQMKTIDLNGEKILLVNAEGNYFAIGAICKHEEWDLSEGTLENRKVTCAGHGAVWDLETGEAEFYEPLEKEPLYEVKVEGEDIMISSEPRS